MAELAGGREGVLRVGERVHRPAGPWTPQVQALLRHVRAAGFSAVPEPFGLDEAGREVVSFIAGDVCHDATSPEARALETLRSAARLLRGYHDACAGFLATTRARDDAWMLPPREPREVVCHGDFAPYNVVLRGTQAIGLIDFDAAHPGPRAWDIAYALYRWAPLMHADNPGAFGELDEQLGRARLFCDAYGLSAGERASLAALVIERLDALVGFMRARAAAGDATFAAHLAAGHDQLYLRDMGHIAARVSPRWG